MQTFRNFIARIFNVRGIEFLEDTSIKELYVRNWNIAWPSMLEGALLSIINAVDTMMVGGIGLSAISAVGLATQPKFIILILGQSMCVGTTAVIARRKGEEDQKGANNCLRQSMIITTVLGSIMLALGFFFAEPMMKFVGAKPDTLEMSVTYFKVISLAMVFNYLSLCICAALKAIGETKVTLITNMTANIVNVVFNYLLIGGNFGFPRLGVLGAAIATAFGTFVSCCVAFWFILKPGGYLRFRFKDKTVWDKESLMSLYLVGSSSIAEAVFLRIGFVINQKLVAEIGTNVYASFQIVQQLSSLSFTVGDGLAVASTSLVGQSLGAERKDLASAYVQTTRKISLVSSLILMVVIFFTRNYYPMLFTDDKYVIYASGMTLLVIAVGLIPQNGRIVYSGCLRGAGDTKFVAFASLISVTFIRPLCTYLFCYPIHALFPNMLFQYTGPWWSFVIDSLIRDRWMKHRIDSGKWQEIKL